MTEPKNGIKFGDGLNAWLKTNWLMGILIVGATFGYARMDFRMQQMQSDIAELKALQTKSVNLQALDVNASLSFEAGVLKYLEADMVYHFPHKKEKEPCLEKISKLAPSAK